jgi:hypothetical protein
VPGCTKFLGPDGRPIELGRGLPPFGGRDWLGSEGLGPGCCGLGSICTRLADWDEG